jgi:hypothetical protein
MKTIVERRAAGLAECAAAGLLMYFAAAAGCQPSVSSHGQRRDVLAAYQFRTLEARLGPEVQVLTVKAAAEQALRSRGYVISDASGGNDRCRVVARLSGDGDWDRLVVESWVADRPPATMVSVTCEPWGDEALSRTVLDGVLNRLGR